jgi:hypothetical protein
MEIGSYFAYLPPRNCPKITPFRHKVFAFYSALSTQHFVLSFSRCGSFAHPPPQRLWFWKTAETSAKNWPFCTLFCGRISNLVGIEKTAT